MRNELPVREKPLSVGDAAPDFTLPDQDRKDWKLADAVKRGDVVLAFYPFAFTSTCQAEMCSIRDDTKAWKAKGAEVVGISCDSFAANKAWAKEQGFEHHMLSDLHRDVVKGYGLYWADLNVANRGTVVIGKSADGKGRVKFVEARPPGQAMDFAGVLAKV